MAAKKTIDEVNQDISSPLELLDKLSTLGKETIDVEITPEFKITLSTIGAEDEAEVFSFASKDDSQYVSRHKRESIVRAIAAINKKSLREYETIEDVAEYRRLKRDINDKIRRIVDAWNDNLITFIYGKWYEIITKSEKNLEDMKILQLVKKEEETKEEKAK